MTCIDLHTLVSNPSFDQTLTMAEPAESASSSTPTPSSPEIQINIKGPNELKLQISISPDKTVAGLKEAIAAKSDVEADRQRLIYSGRVLKVHIVVPKVEFSFLFSSIRTKILYRPIKFRHLILFIW